jgi:ABC-type bacteriocin/lantibiotic exporter with double-glycine peptidase domain
MSAAVDAGAAGKIDSLVQTLASCRWGALDDGRRRWAQALAALVLALKPGVKLHQVLGAAPFDAADLDLVDALNTLANLGFTARRERLKPSRLDGRLLPCLLRPRRAAEEPWVVLGRTADGALCAFDTGSGALETIPADDPRLKRPSEIWLFKRFDPNAQSASRFMRAGSGFSWFRALIGRFSPVLVQVLAAGLFLNLAALSIPIFIMLIYDSVIGSGAGELLPGLAIGAGLAVGLELLLRRVRSHGLSWLASRLDNLVGNRLFAHLLELEPKDVERASTSSQIARIKTFEAVRDFFSGGAFLSVMELPFVVLTLVLIALVAGPLVLAPLVFLVAYAVLFALVRHHVKVAIRVAAKASSARQKFAIEAVEKIEAIRLAGLTDLWADKFRQLSGRECLAHFRLNQLGVIGEVASHALTVLAGATTVAVGAHLFWSGALTTGGLVASMILIWRALAPLHNLCTMVPRLEQLRNSIVQVNALMDLSTEEETVQGRAALPTLRGAVSFRSVRLRYEEATDATLDSLSFEARAGDLVAITGPSGSGKTSALKLIQALYRPELGAVTIDGFDLRQLDPIELRRQVAYAPQSPDIFAGSILDNLRLGNPLASEDEARKALERAGAWAEVSALANGIHTRIAAHGAGALKSGLAAQIGLARAFLHDGKIALIDELPNAVMCGPTGESFKRWLVDARRRKTVFVATMREDVIALADVVVSLAPALSARSGAQASRAAA